MKRAPLWIKIQQALYMSAVLLPPSVGRSALWPRLAASGPGGEQEEDSTYPNQAICFQRPREEGRKETSWARRMGVRGGPTGAEGQSRERLREAENAGFRSFSKCFRRRAAGRTAYQTNGVSVCRGKRLRCERHRTTTKQEKLP